MPYIDAPTAVREIVTATKRRTSKDATAFPFFFIVGAGISAPMVPLASAIEKTCRDFAESEKLSIPALSDDDALDRYEKLLTLVYPNPEERQEFFHDLIHEARISPANLRLAHILESRKLTNLVFTPNFDEMLTRALRLFGVEVVVCDHPKTTQRINPNRADLLQVVHVHGTHWFYDCCNLRGEIEARALEDDNDNAGMADLLNRVLADRSPIVLGYSGWTSDVIMSSLKRALRSRARRHNTYWFCHRRSEADKLPAWLVDHPTVRIVVPEEPVLLPVGLENPLMQEQPKEPVLDARLVLESFITSLGALAPRITREPLPFFADQLVNALQPVTASEGKDLYLIQQVIDQVQHAINLENEYQSGRSEAVRKTVDAVRAVSDAVRRTAYEDAAKVAQQIDVLMLDEAQIEELDHALEAIYMNEGAEKPNRVLKVVELWMEVASRALEFGAPTDRLQARLALAIYAKGFCLAGLGRDVEAIQYYEDVDRRFGQSTDEETRRRVATSLTGRVFALFRLNRVQDAMKVYEELKARYEEDEGTADLIDLAFVTVLRSGEEGSENDINRLDAIWDRYARSEKPFVALAGVRARDAAGVICARLGRSDEAIARWREVAQFATSTTYQLKATAGLSLSRLGDELRRLGRHDEARQCYQRVLSPPLSAEAAAYATARLNELREAPTPAAPATKPRRKKKRAKPRSPAHDAS